MHHVGVARSGRVPCETDIRSPRTGERIEVTGALCPDCAGASSGRRHRTPPARQGLPRGGPLAPGCGAGRAEGPVLAPRPAGASGDGPPRAGTVRRQGDNQRRTRGRFTSEPRRSARLGPRLVYTTCSVVSPSPFRTAGPAWKLSSFRTPRRVASSSPRPWRSCSGTSPTRCSGWPPARRRCPSTRRWRRRCVPGPWTPRGAGSRSSTSTWDCRPSIPSRTGRCCGARCWSRWGWTSTRSWAPTGPPRTSRAACEAYDKALAEAGGVDLQLLGHRHRRAHRLQRAVLLARLAYADQDPDRADAGGQRAVLRAATSSRCRTT